MKIDGQWVNLTPHVIRVYSPDRVTLEGEFPPSGQTARVAVTRTLLGAVAGVSIYGSSTGAVTGLPPVETSGDVQRLIVSLAVRSALPQDVRLFSPGELLRGPDGQPIGCVGLDGNGGAL